MEKAASQNPEVNFFLAVYQEYQPSSHDLHSASLCLTVYKRITRGRTLDGILTLGSQAQSMKTLMS
jgi:hypothetical protein